MYRTSVVRIYSCLCCILLLLAGFADSCRLVIAAPKDGTVFTGSTDAASSLIVADQSGNYGSTAMLTASIIPAVAGKTVSFSVDGTNVGSAMTDVSGTVMLPYTIVNPAGSYPIVASVAATGSVTVSDQHDMFGSTVTLTAKLAPAAGGKIISFTVGGLYAGSATTDVSGTAQLSYTIINPPGSHQIMASFAGDDEITAATGTSALMVTKSITTMSIKTHVGKKYDTIPLTTMLSAYGAGLAGKPVAFGVNKVDAGIATTDGSGKATLFYDINQDAGIHWIIANYEADAYFTASNATSDLLVSAPTTPLNVSNIAVPYDAPVTLRAMLTPAVAGKEISFMVNGTNAGSATTDADGMARLPYTEHLSEGSHDIVASFAGDEDIAFAMDTGILTVIQETGRLLVQDQSGDYGSTVTPKSKLMTPAVAGKTVSFPSVARFAGDANMTVVSNTATLTVTEAAVDVTVQNISGDYGSIVTLTARLTLATAGKPVSFTVAGEDAGIATTDASGTATVAYTILQSAGNHSIVASFEGDGYFAAATGRGTLTVSPAATALNVNTVTGDFGSSVTLTAVLDAPVPVPGKLLEFRVNSVPVGTGVTDASGLAVMSFPYTIDLPAGNHIITVSFAGDPQAAPSTGIGTLTVTSIPAETTVPDAPRNVSAVAGDGEATVSFDAPLNDGGSSITGYTVTAWIGGTPTNITVTDSSSPITITGLTNGATYTFTVVATNGVGDSAASTASNKVTPKATLPPFLEKPANLNAIAGDESVTLKWNDVMGTGSVTYAVYQVIGSSAPDDPAKWTLIQSDVTANIYTITRLTNGTSYAFAVKANNEGGTSNFSNVAIATPRASSNNSGSGGGGDWSGDDSGHVVSTNGTIIIPIGKSGEVSLDGEIIIKAPVGAAEQELRITIEKLLDTSYLVTDQEILASKAFEVLKNFSGNFKKPVTLSIKLDLTKVDNNQKVAVYYYDEDKKTWMEVGDTIDGEWITIEVDHFTKFAVLAVDVKEDDGEESPKQQDPSFTDIAGHWGEHFIISAAAKKLVSGYPDGTFKPNNPVTRAEFTVMLVGALKLDGTSEELHFKDQDKIGTWAKRAVALALQVGIVSGYEDGSFRPNAQITRVEMATMIAKALNVSRDVNTRTDFTDDEDIPKWAKGAVEAIRTLGIVSGRGNNNFVPKDTATRAESVVTLLRMMEVRDYK